MPFGFLIVTLVLIGYDDLQSASEELMNNFENPLFNFLRFILTTNPFNISDVYTFLNFFVLYFFVFVTVYAIYPEHQGLRHRVQLDYALVLFQFIGMVSFLAMATNISDYRARLQSK